MLQLNNSTPFKAEIMLLPDQKGIDTVYTVVKATFTIGDTFGLAAEQAPVTLADEYYDDPVTSSIRMPSDVSIGKLGTDVIVNGNAWAPDGKPTWQMDVSVGVGPVAKTVRVVGDRVWDTGAAGATASWVAPFVSMPLTWERAFGGRDVTDKGPVAEPRNPAGVGFRASNGTKPLVGLPLPNVEDPTALISSWKDAPAPAGFSAIAAHWLPRRNYAGTYDASWEKNRSPYLPDDFDLRYCQVAAPGLVTPGFLRGGEVVDLRGLTRNGVMQFSLPLVSVQVKYSLDDRSVARPGILDTVIIEPDAGRLVMVWRAALSCDKQVLKVREIEAELVETAHGAPA